MAFGSDENKQGFFGKLTDPNKQARNALAMSRGEIAALRKSLDGLAKQVASARNQSVNEISNRKRAAALASKDPAKALDALYAQLADVSARNQKNASAAWNRAKMLTGKQVAYQAKGQDLTSKQKEQLKRELETVKAANEQALGLRELIAVIEKGQREAEERDRRKSLGARGRLTEDLVNFLRGKTVANEFFKNFGKGFFETVGGKKLLDGMKTIGTKFKDALENSAFGKRMRKFTDGFLSWTNKWAFNEKRKELLDKIKQKYDAMGGSGGILGKVAGYAALIAAVGFVGYKIGEWVNDQITEILGMPLGEAIYKLGEWVSKKVEAVQKFFGGIVDSVKGFFTNAKDTAVGMWNSVTGAFDSVTSYVTAIPEQFSKWWESFSLVDSITGAFESISNLVTEKMDAMGKKVAGFFGLDWGGIKAAGKAVVSAVASAPGKAVSKVASFLGGGNAHKEALVKQMDASGIKDPKERAMFMAQMDHESGGFKSTSENLNYSSVAQIRSTFGGNAAIAKMSDAEVQKLVGNKEGLANTVYGNRMGNTEAGDGFKYRGRGVVQLTGKDNYAAAGKAIGVDLVKNPDLAEQPDIAAKIATWYWQSRNLGAKARAGDITGVTKGINGGTIGLDDRNEKYQAYLAATPGAAATTTAMPTAARASSAGGASPTTQAMPAVAMQSLPPPPAPQSVSQSVPASNVTPNIDEIPMVVADSGFVVVNAVGAFT